MLVKCLLYNKSTNMQKPSHTNYLTNFLVPNKHNNTNNKIQSNSYKISQEREINNGRGSSSKLIHSLISALVKILSNGISWLSKLKLLNKEQISLTVFSLTLLYSLCSAFNTLINSKSKQREWDQQPAIADGFNSIENYYINCKRLYQ